MLLRKRARVYYAEEKHFAVESVSLYFVDVLKFETNWSISRGS